MQQRLLRNRAGATPSPPSQSLATIQPAAIPPARSSSGGGIGKRGGE